MSLENPLWRYATALYSQPGVEQYCLQLQDQGVIVTRLLFACWLARRGVLLTRKRMQALPDAWHREVIEPLRAVRLRVRGQLSRMPEAEPCYRVLCQAELAAEQQELMQLWLLGRDWPSEEEADPALLQSNLEQVLGDADDRPDTGQPSPLVAAVQALWTGD